MNALLTPRAREPSCHTLVVAGQQDQRDASSLDVDDDVLDERIGSSTLDASPILSFIKVEELFGRYSYQFDVPHAPDGTPDRLILLHGANGSGKTTLLQLVFHLLSPRIAEGHRSALGQAPFRRLVVGLSTGTQLIVDKTSGLVGPFTITVTTLGQSTIAANFPADDAGNVFPYAQMATDELLQNRGRDQIRRNPRLVSEIPDSNPNSLQSKTIRNEAVLTSLQQSRVMNFITNLEARPYLLADDRLLYSDELRNEGSTLPPELRHRTAVSPTEQASKNLTDFIRRLNRQFQQAVISAQASGSSGANEIYLGVLRELVLSETSSSSENEAPDMLQTKQLLRSLGEELPAYTELGLMPDLGIADFVDLVDGLSPRHSSVAARVLLPYLDSVRARLVALTSAQKLIRLALDQMTRFFGNNPKVVYSPRRGLQFFTEGNETALLPAQLSSGQRQLVLLISTVLLARNTSRLFIIDEPELSLGVPWQREILDAILCCTEGTACQFMVATHSIEIITSNRDALVRLTRQSNREKGPLETAEES